MLKEEALSEDEATSLQDLCLTWDLPVPTQSNRLILFQQLLVHAVLYSYWIIIALWIHIWKTTIAVVIQLWEVMARWLSILRVDTLWGFFASFLSLSFLLTLLWSTRYWLDNGLTGRPYVIPCFKYAGPESSEAANKAAEDGPKGDGRLATHLLQARCGAPALPKGGRCGHHSWGELIMMENTW